MLVLVPRPWPCSLPDVFLGSLAVSRGDLTPSRLRNRSRVVPVLHDVYRPSPVPMTHSVKCRAAALAAGAPLESAVARLDAAARAALVDLPRLRTWLLDRHDDHVVAVRRAAGLADARSASWPESVVRVRLLAAGLDVVPQVVVSDVRGFAGRVDLTVERLRLAIEYDGRWHRDVDQFSADRARLNRLREAGWTVVHVTAETLRHPGALEATVLREVARLASRPYRTLR